MIPDTVAEGLSSAIARAWTAVQPLLGSANYTGCVVSLASLAAADDHLEVVHGQLGAHTARLTELVAEKTGRLRQEHQQHGHMTSAQSRDPWKVKLGGAIVAGPMIITVAALTEAANEALALCLARQLGLLDGAQAEAIAAIGPNRLYLPFSTTLEL